MSRKLFSWVLPAWKTMAAGILLAFFTVFSGAGLMGTAAYIIAAAALHPSMEALSVAIVGVRFFGLSRAVFRYAERYISHDATFRLLSRIRVFLYAAVEPQIPAAGRGKSGEMLYGLVSAVEELKYVYLRVLNPYSVAALVLIAAALFLALFSSPMVYALIVGFVAAGICWPVLIRYLAGSTVSRRDRARGRFHCLLVDTIRGITELTAYDAAGRQQEQIAAAGGNLARLQKKKVRLTGLADAGSQVITSYTLWAILFLAVPLVYAKKISGIDLAVILLVVQSSFEAVLPLGNALYSLAESRTAARRLEAVQAWTAPAASRKPGLKPRYPVPVEARSLCFSYRDSRIWTLENLSFTLAPGERVALVGPSGAGKSTMVSLLLGFWPYQSGSLRLGNFELKDCDPGEIRRHIAVVTQHTHIFNTTIRDNILLARPEAGWNELEQAAEDAALTELIERLPAGYDTLTGLNGRALSGGERQRIAIARALLKDAPLLFLDEPTAGLDPLTAREVMAGIDKLMAGRTTLLVTHQLTGLAGMDKILVLSRGKLVEQGNMRELLSRQGLFYEMWKLQQDRCNWSL
ncbi:abc transporter [Lucifera butyrica]|uniref:Abc transporter n=1 Tax=Lucifera butyrica TaxID=1351585 RepID=A0A498R0J7_9FIRM|nr:thiol reductant ABC exporter subunit CydC [Lucifera butyrica]VBB05014.1 abc transporter [Lucifera butyrica]